MSSFAWAVSLRKGQNIVGTDAAHPSTIYPWQRVAEQSGCELRLVRGDGNGYVDPAEVADRIDDQTAVVSISHVEYRTGQTYDLVSLARRAHSHGAILAVDATQSAGQVPLDVRESQVDVLVSSAYKWLCGPFGVAVMYVAPRWQEQLKPGIVGWRSHANMWEFRADRLEYPKTARRFEASTMAYGCALGLAKAVDLLAHIGAPRILAHNQALADLLGRELLARGAVLVSPQHQAERSSIISVRFPGKQADEIARRLNAADVVVSHRVGAIRISPHLYNNESDVWKAVETLDAILA
jgi:selenocysteine lyase/cysteine desulfurase